MTLLGEVGSECGRDDTTLDRGLNQILDAAIIIAGAQKGNIQLTDSSSGLLQIAAHRWFKKPFLNFFVKVSDGEPTACAAALQSGKRAIIEDVLTSKIFVGQPSQKVLLDEDIRTVISTPLISSKGHILGMLSVHFQQPHKPPDLELHLIDLLTRQAADFLERRRISDALRESEQRLRGLASIVQFSDDAIVSKNLDGIITSWNKGAERVFGYTAEEAIGQPITMLTSCGPGSPLLHAREDAQFSYQDDLPKAKALRPDVPVVMITAYADAETKRKALEDGAEAIITKPIDFVTLRTEVDLLVERACPTVAYSAVPRVFLAPRTYWKGYLKRLLVSYSIALYPATRARKDQLQPVQ
jgi:PAS domain-containing protein